MPCDQGKRKHLRHEILDLGSNNNVAQHRMCSIISLKNHSTLLYTVTAGVGLNTVILVIGMTALARPKELN